MATGGSGDVLGGMIAAFCGQGLDPFDAARFAVYVHGYAADIAVQNKTCVGLIPSDVIDTIPLVLKQCKVK